jgi:N-acetylmuramoyl-L-alanine amidase
VWVFGFLLLSASLSAAPPSKDYVLLADISDGMRAVLTRDYEIELVVRPHAGDAWTRLARRVAGDAARWEELAQLNQADDSLKADRPVRVPYALLKPALQRDIVASLFPSDKQISGGWVHIVAGGRGIEGESLWNIAEWFTGDGANYTAIRKANPQQGLSTRPGDVIVVPQRLLIAAFGGEAEGENAPKTALQVRKTEDDQAQRSSADEDASEASAAPSVVPALSYERSTSEPYATYRLQKGEALYSSVAIRFTGRVYAKDVNDVIEQIVKFNAIEDVARIPVGYPVKIPMDLLLPEYLPQDDPARLASEASKRASAKMARKTRARNLAGVKIILDAGHGGRDPGTAHDDLWESMYVYDVTVRLRQVLEKKSAAKVSMTTRSPAIGYDPSRSDTLGGETDHYVLTTPRYLLDDAIVGVNLRWYLANSMFRRAIQAGADRDKVVFISIHADSLHPSLRGAMAYIPGASYVQGSYEKREKVYLAHAEVRERPKVRQSEEDALTAEGLSRNLAESVVESFQRKGLKVHPFNPVRDNVVREGGAWVPAVIRYNVVPTRMLLEICNLGNRRDRELIKTKKYRQQIAEAIYAGIVDFFAEQPVTAKSLVVSR